MALAHLVRLDLAARSSIAPLFRAGLGLHLGHFAGLLGAGWPVRFTSGQGMPCPAAHERARVLKGEPPYCKALFLVLAGPCRAFIRRPDDAEVARMAPSFGRDKAFGGQTALEKFPHGCGAARHPA